MRKNIYQGMALVLMVVMMAGCATQGGVSAKSYFEDRDRVDQEMSTEGYNYGYIQGTPVAEDRTNLKKTRRVYVFEVTKEPVVEETEVLLPPRKKLEPRTEEMADPEPEPEPEPETRRPAAERIVIPSFDEEEEEEVTVPAETRRPEAVEAEDEFTDYEVQKGDTLQKISKKFYNTYRKWGQIMDANSDILDDPNKIKPGMVLRIPQE